MHLNLFKFINESPTPFHVIDNLKSLAESKKFTNDINSKRYFYTLGKSAAVFFKIPEETSKIDGFHIIGTHTDSPTLKLRPNALIKNSQCDLLATEVYGGVLHHTWCDRDLSLAGIVFYNEDNLIRSKLVNFSDTICKIPNLAIHLNKDVNKIGFKVNPQLHFNALLSAKSGQKKY
jgi:aspartyl aminopeptidase